ncbi:DNA damage response protein RcaA [Massariosphaeria phaeospora]|uniref:DNA damage response protein RcaA n=1 Tax=Massariosphaeria phaeospora TaxID=100035 RepID=A0A7C8I4M9_9PLEO|nr:DNA damage response protein RcaA [Massariosphaeria phaeospora]
MWILEHESLFGGKRIWLRPGSQQLYGRTTSGHKDSQADGKQVFIDNKNVSRKHMIIKVHDVPEGDGTRLHSRSQIEIIDLSCRQGTDIEGQRSLKSTKEADGTITYDKMVLSGTEHTIKIAASYPAFKIKWQPVVITYASKDHKARSVQLHPLDIKTTTEFVYGKTTHVVSQKRNLPKVLQGLVAGAHIVTGEFIDAILAAAERSVDGSGNYVPSKLEEDLDTWWPKEKECIPPIGAEPIPRPEQMLEPDSNRSEVFSGLTFVFSNEPQYNSLQAPIAGGGGKALLFNIRVGETTVKEYVDFVSNAAGEKRRNEANNGRLPVVSIRLSGFPSEMEAWATDFVTGVDQALKQRSIQQNEFLDAILTKDASSLQKPPAEVIEVHSVTAQAETNPRSTQDLTPTFDSKPTSQAPEATSTPSPEPAKSNPRKRPMRRGQTTSRFTGFDDYEPPPKARKIEEDASMEDVQESIVTTNLHNGSQPRSTAGTQADPDSQRQIEESVETADQIEQFIPAAAAARRRRAVTRAASASVEPEARAATRKTKARGAEKAPQSQKPKMKDPKDINVREQTRLRVKEQEEKIKADEESLREALEGVDIAEIRDLVRIEEMKVKPHENRPDQRTGAHSERWNDEWNGRKNFKKFRRRGAERGPQAQKVLVTLEETPQKKGFGVNSFFLEDTETTQSKEDERRPARRTAREPEDDSEPEPGFTRRKRTTQSEVVNVEDSGSDDESVVASSSGRRNKGDTQRVAETQLSATQTQTQKSTRKRGPASVAAGQPATKKSRVARRDDDSDEEETGFRFRRRG